MGIAGRKRGGEWGVCDISYRAGMGIERLLVELYDFLLRLLYNNVLNDNLIVAGS